jgi:hypothetical protein
VEELLQRDTVSCLVAHEKFIVRRFNIYHSLIRRSAHHFSVDRELKTPTVSWKGRITL